MWAATPPCEWQCYGDIIADASRHGEVRRGHKWVEEIEAKLVCTLAAVGRNEVAGGERKNGADIRSKLASVFQRDSDEGEESFV